MDIQSVSDCDLGRTTLQDPPPMALSPDDVLGMIERHMRREGIDSVASDTGHTLGRESDPDARAALAVTMMMPLSVDIVVPPIDQYRFSGGILCVFEHAQGLSDAGHRVRVVPLEPSPRPEWFPDIRFDYCERSGLIGHADVTIATTCETLLPVAHNAGGPKIYFMQHFAPYFQREVSRFFIGKTATGTAGEYCASTFYQLGMTLVANSTWLKGMVEQLTGRTDVQVCPNAIRTEDFHPDVPHASPPTVDRVGQATVISYGGRDAPWKGFREMARAVAQVRRERPGTSLRWMVYGGALLPPRNEIADYEDLGYLSHRDLGHAYRAADILLSASWYESFPLFPLEAMACGVATITSAAGTAEYARHGDTAHIVQPQNVQSVAAGLRRLVDDVVYRRRLAQAGSAEARTFTWARAVERMDCLVRATAPH